LFFSSSGIPLGNEHHTRRPDPAFTSERQARNEINRSEFRLNTIDHRELFFLRMLIDKPFHLGWVGLGYLSIRLIYTTRNFFFRSIPLQNHLLFVEPGRHNDYLQRPRRKKNKNFGKKKKKPALAGFSPTFSVLCFSNTFLCWSFFPPGCPKNKAQ